MGKIEVDIKDYLHDEVNVYNEVELDSLPFDSISDGNITEVDGKKVLTPLGAYTENRMMTTFDAIIQTEDWEDGIYGSELMSRFEVLSGDIVRVTVNGNTYDLIASPFDESATSVGNPKFAGGPDDGSDVPFVIFFYGGADFITDEIKEYAVKIEQIGEIVHPINNKYIEGAPIFVISQEYDPMNPEDGDKIYNAFKSGKILYWYNSAGLYGAVIGVRPMNDCGGRTVIYVYWMEYNNIREISFLFNGTND